MSSPLPLCSSTVIHALRDRAEPLAFFYFDTNNSQQRTVSHLLCWLVKQLSAQAPSPDATLAALWRAYPDGGQLTNDDLIEKAFIPILNEFTKPVHIVIDALDECEGGDKLLDFVTKLVEAALPNVHLILTSRPEVPRSRPDLAGRAVSVSLEGCVDVDEDIALYVAAQLSTFASDWEEENRALAEDGFRERVGGM